MELDYSNARASSPASGSPGFGRSRPWGARPTPGAAVPAPSTHIPVRNVPGLTIPEGAPGVTVTW